MGALVVILDIAGAACQIGLLFALARVPALGAYWLLRSPPATRRLDTRRGLLGICVLRGEGSLSLPRCHQSGRYGGLSGYGPWRSPRRHSSSA